MPAATTIAIIGATTAVAGTAYAINRQEKAASAARAASSAQQNQQKVQADQTRRRAFREAQQKRAMLAANAQALGVSGGSGVAGGGAAFASLFGSALGFSSQMTGLSREITSFGAAQQTALSQAQMGSSLSNLGLTAFQNSEQISGLFT